MSSSNIVKSIDDQRPLLPNEEPTAPENENPPPKRNCFQRTFSKLTPGSLRGSVLNLSILSLGTGCLALPQKVGQMSLVVSPFAIIIAGLANVWTLLLLSKMASQYNIKNYSGLVKKLCGKRLSYFLDLIIIENVLGIIILYQVIIYKLIGGLINDLGGYGYKDINDFLLNSFWNKRFYKFIVNYGVSIVVLFPLCILRDVSKMRFASLFGIISLSSVILIVVVESPWYIKYYFKNIYNKDDPNTYLNIKDIIKTGFTSDMYFFKSCATLFYAYSCHIGAFPVLSALTNNTRRRVDKVFKRAITLDCVCYIIIGIAGYLTQPINTPDLIIERRNIFSNDWVMIIGRMAVILTLFTKIAVNYNSLRVSTITLMGKDTKEMGKFLNFIITFITLALTTLVCALYQSITDYISLLGSFSSVPIAFFFPCLVYVKGNEYPLKSWKNIISIILSGILILIGLVSGYFTITSIINKSK